MPACFWILCHCPDQEPCAEHTGTGCSFLGGRFISAEDQVGDAVTRECEAALAQLDRDSQRLDQIKAQLEARKAELERDRQDLDQQAAAASTRADRQAVVNREREIERKYRNLETEVRDLVREIDNLGNASMTAMTTVSGRLLIPYSDPSGYCECYQEKLRQLARLATSITAELATLAAATAAFNAAKAAAIPKLRITFTLAAGIFLALFIILGVPQGLVVAAFIALLFAAITVIGLVIQLASRRSAMLASRKRLLALRLSYYRIQQIPTCQPVDEDDDDEEDDDDHGGDEGDHGGENGQRRLGGG